jgi:hypothetical protein
MPRREVKPVKKLGVPEADRTHPYRITVGGRQKFHGVEPGDTVDLDLTDEQLEVHIRSGVAVEHERLDVVEGGAAEAAPQDESHQDAVSIAADEGAFITKEAGPEPEHK